MEFLSPEQLPKTTGRFLLLWGKPGVGKSLSTLRTASDPIAYIGGDPRNIQPTLDECNLYRPDLKIKIAYYEKWQPLIDLLENEDNFKDVLTVLLDGTSYLMNVSIASEIEDETFEARSEMERKRKPLISQTKLSEEGWGTLSGLMFRIINSLGRLSQQGKIVIMTAWQDKDPKWGKGEIELGPTYKGREFPKNVSGPIDLIGFVESRYNSEGKLLFPPKVSFEGDGFLCKWSGIRPKNKRGEELNPVVMPLDFRKILRLNENE